MPCFVGSRFAKKNMNNKVCNKIYTRKRKKRKDYLQMYDYAYTHT